MGVNPEPNVPKTTKHLAPSASKSATGTDSHVCVCPNTGEIGRAPLRTSGPSARPRARPSTRNPRSWPPCAAKARRRGARLSGAEVHRRIAPRRWPKQEIACPRGTPWVSRQCANLEDCAAWLSRFDPRSDQVCPCSSNLGASRPTLAKCGARRGAKALNSCAVGESEWWSERTHRT